jgi:hypothetical protein
LWLTTHSEEQQPLENFFRAKGIKTKNEMADDVCILFIPLNSHANNVSYSLGQFLQLPFKTKISRPVTTERLRTAVVPTRTMRALTKISKPIRNQKSARSSILIIKAAALIAMRRWKTQRRATTQKQPCQNAQRRNRKCRKNDCPVGLS